VKQIFCQIQLEALPIEHGESFSDCPDEAEIKEVYGTWSVNELF
jgi:hypothetical protein